jgi:putative membrane protein
MYGYGYGPMWGFGWIFSVIFWIAVVVAIIYVVKWLKHGKYLEHHNQKWPWCKSTSAMDILKERYAKGEIDKKEFEERKKELE